MDYTNLILRLSGAYTFDKNGQPYTVPSPNDDSVPQVVRNEMAQEYNQVHAWALAHPDRVYSEQPPAPPTLEEAKESKLAEINAIYMTAVAPAKAGVPEDEIYTWDIQKLEAEAWQINNSIATPAVDKIALGRGIDRELILQKILEKVAAYREGVFFATGIRQGIEDAINNAATVEDVQVIAWPTAQGIAL